MVGKRGINRQSRENRDFFNGDIRYIDYSHKITKNVTSKDITLEGAYYGAIAAYDSLLIFRNFKLPGYFFNVFNVDKGIEIGAFCKIGQGPKEASSVGLINQVFKQGNNLMTLLHASNEGKLFFGT